MSRAAFAVAPLYSSSLITVTPSLTVKKLVEAGKPVPQPSITLPPLVTPAGTSITIGPGPGQTVAPSALPPSANGPLRPNEATSNGAGGQGEDDVSVL